MERDIIQEKKEFLFKSLKHLRLIDVVVILTSVTALYIFRLQDGYQLDPIWQLKQPALNLENLYVQPLITDIDGNGLKELIIASDDRIAVFVHHENKFDGGDHEHDEDDTTQGVLYHLHLKSELKFNEILGPDQTLVYPIAMSAGCTSNFHNELCPQSLAIVWSDWLVTLLSDQLKILWKSRPFKLTLTAKLKITEMSVMVVQANSSDFTEKGLVIFGGVLNIDGHQTTDSQRQDQALPTMLSRMPEEVIKERAGVEPNITHDILSLDPALVNFIGHYTTYALDGETGKIKWKHEPGDFEPVQSDMDKHVHFKLRLRKKSLHKGELHWKKFSRSLLKHLPYSWNDPADTDITLGHFQRAFSSAPTQSKPTKPHVPKQFQTIWENPQKTTEAVDNERPNTVVLRHRQAIEVLSLENGSPLCVLPLDITNRINLGDVNGDGVIDSVKTYIYQDSSFSVPSERTRDDTEGSVSPSSCYIVATDASSSSVVHFNASLCDISSSFYFSSMAAVHFKKLASLAPLLVKPLERRSGLSHHVLGYGLAQPQSGMDSFVLLSSGWLSAFGPSGRPLWQVDTGVTWSESDDKHVISTKSIALNSEGRKDAVVILGVHEVVVISLVDGSILSRHSLPCLSVQPLLTGDINNDINEEFLVRCTDRYVGFSLSRYNRIGWTILLYSGIACAVGFLLLLIKFVEREELALDTIEHIMTSMRLFPGHGTTRF